MNSFKVLKKGGIFRCIVPDLESLARSYINDLDNGDNLASLGFINNTLLGIKERPRGLKGFLNSFFGNSHHLWMWDNKSLSEELKKLSGKIDFVSYCPHDYSTEGCSCRKPATGLLEEIENHFKISIKGSYFIGDKESDIRAALNHGCTPLLVETGYGSEAKKAINCPPVNNCFKDLSAAVNFVLSS